MNKNYWIGKIVAISTLCATPNGNKTFNNYDHDVGKVINFTDNFIEIEMENRNGKRTIFNRNCLTVCSIEEQ